jgi:hypothetical protein
VPKHVAVIKDYIIVYVVSAFSGFGERKSTEIGGPINCMNQIQISLTIPTNF